MDANFYKEQMARLQDNFGEKKFPPEMIKTMWYRLKGFADDIFEQAVNTLICESKYPPKLSEIIEHCNQAKATMARPVKDRPYCPDCDGNGVVFAVHKENKCEYSFRCLMCDPPEFAGLPVWTSEMVHTYERIAKVI